MSDITSQSLTSLVKNIKEKKLSSEEVTKAFVDRSEKSKELNSYITEDFSNAIDKSKKFDEKPNLDLKLPGIPMAVKDLFCTKDIRTTAGSKILENFIPTYESSVTQNIWNEGAILLGKLNCDEFAMGSSNETSFYGNVQNPIDKGLVPGGSSGGSAAAVSGQLTPITIGTDTGGSIRQPASFTGTVGLKPTYGSCSRYGIVAFASSLDQAGPMSQNVEDCALLQEVISSYDNKDSTSIDFKRSQYSKELSKDIKGKKIGIPKEYRVEGMPKEIEELWKKGIEYAKDCGAEIIDISLPNTSYALPIICNPKGYPDASRPAGIDIAGKPAKFTGTVKMSFKYIETGSFFFSPILNAELGVEGVKIASTFLYASSKSFLINFLTFCAFK